MKEELSKKVMRVKWVISRVMVVELVFIEDVLRLI